MSKVISYSEFLYFLKSENILYNFEYNYTRQTSLEEYFEHRIDDDSLIIGAFIWNSTVEGTSFWQQINQKFLLYIRNRERKFKLKQINEREV